MQHKVALVANSHPPPFSQIRGGEREVNVWTKMSWRDEKNEFCSLKAIRFVVVRSSNEGKPPSH